MGGHLNGTFSEGRKMQVLYVTTVQVVKTI